VSRYQKGKTNLDFTEARDSECQWHQTAVVHKNKTKRRSKIYISQYILRYNMPTVKLQSVIREFYFTTEVK